MSPEYCRPPSPTTGTPAGRQAFATSWIAVICGTPTPATTRVVQIDPGPTPTLTPSTPASTRAWAALRVATLPPTTSTCATAGSLLSRRIISSTLAECPCAMSTMSRSTPASTSAIARFSASSKIPIAAPTRSRPESSLVASGYFSLLAKSFTVIRPLSRPASSTSGSFSTLCRPSSRMASSPEVPTGAVTKGIGVMTSRTRRVRSVSKRRSRFVTMPSSRPDSSTTGRPDTRYRPHSASTSARVASGPVVTGWLTIPASDRFTRSTWLACSSIGRLRCSTPRPPWRAIAIAIRDSVTVSMGEDSSGTRSEIRLETREVGSAAEGMTSLSCGTSRTSSKVRPRAANFSGTSWRAWVIRRLSRAPSGGHFGVGLARGVRPGGKTLRLLDVVPCYPRPADGPVGDPGCPDEEGGPDGAVLVGRLVLALLDGFEVVLLLDGFGLFDVRDGFGLFDVRDGFGLFDVRDGFGLFDVRDGFGLFHARDRPGPVAPD